MDDPTDIRAWQRLDSRTTTSGRLEEGDPPRLAAIGVGHVVNLALDDHPEALGDEAAKLAAAGIAYTHIPVPFDAPDEGHFAAFQASLDSADAPVHVHCILNWWQCLNTNSCTCPCGNHNSIILIELILLLPNQVTHSVARCDSR